jgi:hypothetical protein
MIRLMIIIAMISTLSFYSCNNGGGSESSDSEPEAAETTTNPEPDPGLGQLIVDPGSGIDKESVDLFQVGTLEKLDSVIVGDTLVVNNLTPGEADVIAMGTLNVDGASLQDGKTHGRRIPDVKITADEATNLGKVDLPKVGGVTGTVKLIEPDDVEDHAGIKVYIPGTQYSATSDTSGAFALQGLPVGVHNFYFEKDGYHRGAVEGVEVETEGNKAISEIGLVLETGSLGGLMINGGNETTASLSVDITLLPSDGAVLYKISENELFSDASFIPLQTSTTYTFKTKGEKVLYVQFANANGQPSSVFEQSIVVTTPLVALTSPEQGHKEFDDSFSLTGTCAPGLKVQIIYGAGNTGPTSVDCKEEKFTASITASGTAGARAITLKQTDLEGTTSKVTLNYERIENLCNDSDYKGNTRYANTGKPGIDGTSGKEFVICTIAHLNSFAEDAESNPDMDKHFKLGADLDVGSITNLRTAKQGFPFTGSFDGQNHTISNLTTGNGADSTVGLFVEISGATIKNLKITNATLQGGSQYNGILVGKALASSTIDNCQTSGPGGGSGGDKVGGLVGWLSSSTITNSSSSAAVAASNTAGGLVGLMDGTASITGSYASGTATATFRAGGLVGKMEGTSSVTKSYATGAVSATATEGGGLVGDLEAGAISESYATGDVSGNSLLGGLIGSSAGTVSDSYATGNVNSTSGAGAFNVGGLIGGVVGSTANRTFSIGAVTNGEPGGYLGQQLTSALTGANNYWNTTTTSLADAVHASHQGGFGAIAAGIVAGKTTTEMQAQPTAMYTGWDFTNVWKWKAGSGVYPSLKWEP